MVTARDRRPGAALNSRGLANRCAEPLGDQWMKAIKGVVRLLFAARHRSSLQRQGSGKRERMTLRRIRHPEARSVARGPKDLGVPPEKGARMKVTEEFAWLPIRPPARRGAMNG
jgi:hypothetical protein